MSQLSNEKWWRSLINSFIGHWKSGFHFKQPLSCIAEGPNDNTSTLAQITAGAAGSKPLPDPRSTSSMAPRVHYSRINVEHIHNQILLQHSPCDATLLAREQWQSALEIRLGNSHIGRTGRQPNYPNQLAPKRGSQRRFCLDPISPGELIRQTLYCPGPGHSQQEVLSAHCSRQPLMAPLISCS